jgi:hypothetical protein
MMNLQVSTFVKPKTTSLAIGIERIEVLDHYSKSEPSPFFAIDFGHALSNPKEPMLSLKLDISPPDEEVDLRLAAKTQPVLINFSKVLIDRILEFYGSDGASAGQPSGLEQLAMVGDLGLDKISKQVCFSSLSLLS